jgi:hypothetical protein
LAYGLLTIGKVFLHHQLTLLLCYPLCWHNSTYHQLLIWQQHNYQICLFLPLPFIDFQQTLRIIFLPLWIHSLELESDSMENFHL